MYEALHWLRIFGTVEFSASLLVGRPIHFCIGGREVCTMYVERLCEKKVSERARKYIKATKRLDPFLTFIHMNKDYSDYVNKVIDIKRDTFGNPSILDNCILS